jgi:hypothetical protein
LTDEDGINYIYVGVIPYSGVSDGEIEFTYKIWEEPIIEPIPAEPYEMPIWLIGVISASVMICVFCIALIYLKRLLARANKRELAWEVNRRAYGGKASDWGNKGKIVFEDTEKPGGEVSHVP